MLRREEGHANAAIGSVIALVGAVALGIGAGTDAADGWLACVAGIVLGVGIVVAGVLHHRVVDYDIFARLEKLEGKR